MSTTASTPQWGLMGKVKTIPGYAYGCRYPSVLITFEGRPLQQNARDALMHHLAEVCPGLQFPKSFNQVTFDWPQSVNWLLSVWQVLQAQLGLPVFETGKILAISTTQVRCVIPTLAVSKRALVVLIKSTFEYLEQDKNNSDSPSHRVQQASKLLGKWSAKGSNVPRFVKAAYEMGIPFQELPGIAYQYGVCNRARWLDSSFTDVTPTISANLAQNKVWASALLRQAGLPVPSHKLIRDANDALKTAHMFGFPVVVKPANLDGGIGVAAGLQSDAEVLNAFENAKKFSDKILVEKHFEGRDYRVTVFNGEVIWAIERVPAGVAGDGYSTVSQLIDSINSDPRRGNGPHAPLKRLIIDAESQQLLEKQGLNPFSVPAYGQFVRLRRTANVATGGTPVAAFDDVHPDNALLAIRAAETLRLDLAGIDLLIPNIAVSWRESGAAICEVNAQPNLGQTTSAHLYASILTQILPEGGRVLTIVVFGATQTDKWLYEISSQLTALGMNVGLAERGKVSINGEILQEGELSPYAAGKALTLSRSIDAMVIAIEDDSILSTGLPVARFDALIIAGTNLHSRDSHVGNNLQRRLTNSLFCLLPACDGVVVAPISRGLRAKGFNKRTSARWCESDSNNDQTLIEQTITQLHELVLIRSRKLVLD